MAKNNENEESEETEVKNIEEVKDEVAEELEAWRNVEGGVDDEGIDTIMVIIDQLDEAEVLSKNWIDEHITDGHNVNLGDKVVYADELDGVLVTKQEEITEEQVAEHLRARNMTAVDSGLVYREKLDNKIVIEKPVIPQFVADWYESEGKRNSWWNWFYKWGRDESRSDLETKTIKWMQDYNEKKFVDMFLHGYTVEEERKYYVLGKHDTPILFRDHRNRITETSNLSDIYPKADSEDFELTEQEIKDYDPRYWAFRKPVEELEE